MPFNNSGLRSLGVNALNPPDTVFMTWEPTQNDYIMHDVGKFWYVDYGTTPATWSLWYLASKANVQSALETIDDFSKAPFAQADHGTGLSGKTMLTNVSYTGGGTGAGEITPNSGSTPPVFGGYLKMYLGTTVVYVPYFTDIKLGA